MSAHNPQIVDNEELIPILDYQFTGNNETQERKRVFIEAFREDGTIYHAALSARVNRCTVYRWLERDKAFAQALEDSKEDVYDKAETSAYKRAMAGDSILLMFYLKAHRPKFRDRSTIDIQLLQNEIRERLASLQLLPESIDAIESSANHAPERPEQKEMIRIDDQNQNR